MVCSDVRLQEAVLKSADLVILNNAFEFFCSLEEQAKYVCKQLMSAPAAFPQILYLCCQYSPFLFYTASYCIDLELFW